MAKKKILTPEQLIQLEAYAGIRLPNEHISVLLGFSKDTLERLAKKDAAVHAAIERGRSKSSGKVYNTLYSQAVGKPAYTDEKGTYHPAVPVNFNALKFWCQSQEGFKTTTVVEVKDENEKLTDEQAKAKLAALMAKI